MDNSDNDLNIFSRNPMANRGTRGFREKAGLSPGTLVYVGKSTEPVRISLYDYSRKELQELTIEQIENTFEYRDKPSVTWINVDGLHDIELMQRLGDHFGIHPLVLEDVLNTAHRPKLDEFDKYHFMILKMIDYDYEESKMRLEHLALLLGKNFVISFQESPGDVLEPLRERIRNSQGRVRKLGADYLFYAIIDTVVDNYFSVLEQIEDNIETIDDEVMSSPTPATLRKIHALKKDVQTLRRYTTPLREINRVLLKGESELLEDNILMFFRDLQDHVLHAIDALESARDNLSGMSDFYMSTVSNNMNHIMKVLTIIASLFIPLTFIAGVYGMNFEVIPELKWRYGYLYVWLLMLGLAGGILVLFRHKKWI